MMSAEESTAWPMVTRPVDVGGLGFGFKWNMGWMHDTLKYFKTDPVYRQYHQSQLTFSIWYAFDEQFILPLSHDEVVHMKGSLINKMAGDHNQKFANLRAMYTYMMAHPGKKLLFMGGEFAQFAEWNYKQSLDWHLTQYPLHKGIQKLVSDLNALYQKEPALYLYDEKHQGFEWIDYADAGHNVIAFLRKSDKEEETILVVCNFSDTVLDDYRLGVPYGKEWQEIFNSQYSTYEGWDITNPYPKPVEDIPMHGLEKSISLRLPPLGVVYMKQVQS
jgi:1,4-alpha-glucan branching enzyme